MSFTCSQPPPYLRQYTPGVLLLTILVCLTVSSVSSFPSKGDHECPNCSEQYIKIINAAKGKCVRCWPCPECNDGAGLSVACPSTVIDGTKIHCVPCIRGVNFSDISSTDQCQPCGVCSGRHEHVLHECTPESDVKCDCDAGFYRNKTTNECLPCGFCPGCSNDDEISSKCQEGEGETGKHPKPWPSSYGSSLSTVVDSKDGHTVVKSYSTVLATSLSFVTASYLHATTTPKLLFGSTNTFPVPSRTQQIQATSTRALEWSKYELTPTQSATRVIYHNIHKTVNTDILIAVLAIVCVFILICVFWFLYRKFKKSRRRRSISDQRKPVRFSKLQQNEHGNPVFSEEDNSRRSSDGDAPIGNVSEISGGKEDPVPGLSTMNTSKDLIKTGDSVLDGRVLVGDQFQHTAGRGAVQKGIPSSLEVGTGNPIAKGHHYHGFPEDDQGDLIIASVNEKTVTSGDPESSNASLQNKMPTANNTVNVFLNFNPGNIEQTTDPSQIQRAAFPPFAELPSHGHNLAIPSSMSGIPVANQGAISGLSSTAAPAVQPSQGNRGYMTHITHVPLPVIHKICMMLDLKRKIDENDHRMLGNELGLNSLEISTLVQKCDSPSNVLLMQVFSAMPNSGTLEHLIPILTKMGRHDVIQVIDEWVGSQNCTQVAQVN